MSDGGVKFFCFKNKKQALNAGLSAAIRHGRSRGSSVVAAAHSPVCQGSIQVTSWSETFLRRNRLDYSPEPFYLLSFYDVISYMWSLGPSIPGPGPPALPIWRAFNNSSHRSRLAAILELEAMQFLNTLKESNTPSSSGSMGSPVSRFRPTTLPSAYSSCRSATVFDVSLGGYVI